MKVGGNQPDMASKMRGYLAAGKKCDAVGNTVLRALVEAIKTDIAATWRDVAPEEYYSGRLSVAVGIALAERMAELRGEV